MSNSEEWYHHEEREPDTSRTGISTYPQLVGLPDLAEPYLRGRSLSPRVAHHNGWIVVTSESGYARLMVPCTSPMTPGMTSGPMTFYQTRAMDPRDPRRWDSPPGVPRGNAIAIVRPVGASRGDVVVEGPLDALAAAGEGYRGLALLGVTPPAGALDFLASLTHHVIVVPDGDMKLLGVALGLVDRGVKVKIRLPYPWKDLAEAPRDERRRILSC